METTTFVEKSKKLSAFRTTITVERTPATLSEHRILRSRWFDYVADHVLSCSKVRVVIRREYLLAPPGSSDGGVTQEEFFEITTATGKGIVLMHSEKHSELDVFIPNSGKALIHGLAFWKKHGFWVGHGVGYLRALSINVNTRGKVDRVCAAQLYAVSTGKPWGSS